MQRILKKIWKFLPKVAVELPLQILCSLFAPRKNGASELDVGHPVYVIGNFQAGGGISRSAELYAQRFKNKEDIIRVDTTLDMLQTIKNPINENSLLSIHEVRCDQSVGTVIIHLNPPQFQWLLCRLGRNFLKNKRIVAYWAWELEDIPRIWKHALRFADAVEVPSTFTMRAIARNTDKKVTICPHITQTYSVDKKNFAADGRLRCLYIFDMASLCSRKNPQGVIEAFTRAFTPEQASLTIKVGQSERCLSEFKKLRALTVQYPHITIIDQWLDSTALKRLYTEHDIYLSLHRSEGYGLTIQEALHQGLYVVATGWSGNMDFMTGDYSFAVPYTLTPIGESGKDFGVAPSLNWAEPDIDAAVDILHKLYDRILKKN